jgi:hypothetical protein
VHPDGGAKVSGTINVFISHVHEEVGLGAVIKEWIEDAFRGSGVRAFLSGDRGDLPPGKKWLDVIEETMGRSRVMVSLISPLAIGRPWINIELGAAWIRKLPVIPVYHSGLTASELPRPFQDFNGVSLGSIKAGSQLIEGLADALGLSHPKKLPLDKFREEMLASLATPRDSNRWGISITTPTKGQTVSRKLTVQGTIIEPLPPGHSLRVLRAHPSSGAVAPSGRVNVRGREWEALDVDLGGEPGEPRGIEAWVVGSDGDALLRHWEDSAKVHFQVNEELKRLSGSYGKWLPYLHLTTRDMVRCASVVVTRKRTSE